MAFIDDRLLECVAYGFSFGPEFSTTIESLRNGAESRNANWATFRWRGTAGYQNISPDAYGAVLGAFLAARGMASTFRFKNWLEDAVVGQSLGNAPSGTTAVQLVRDYDAFGGASFQRTITKPVAGTVTVYQSGTPKAGTIDTSTGLFTPATAWTAGQPLTADFEYDLPVRFDADYMPFSYDNFRAINGEITVIEVQE